MVAKTAVSLMKSMRPPAILTVQEYSRSSTRPCAFHGMRSEPRCRKAHSVAAKGRREAQSLSAGERDAVEQAESVGHQSSAPRSIGIADAVITLHPGATSVNTKCELLEEVG